MEKLTRCQISPCLPATIISITRAAILKSDPMPCVIALIISSEVESFRYDFVDGAVIKESI
jgi:hypothetical protein